MINKTGAPSVKGTIVMMGTVVDDSFIVATASTAMPIGVVLDDGVPDGEYCRIVRDGPAQLLLKDTVSSAVGNWVYMSDVAGRADASLAAPPGGTVTALETHMSELGHCRETKTGGTDVLAWCIVHLN